MENLLRKLGITGTRNLNEILPLLEEKQVEYLERLDNVEDENRKKHLQEELKEIEMAIASIGWIKQQEPTGIKRDKNDDAEDFSELKKQKESQEQYELGCMYDFGIGVDKDEKLAFSWYMKSAEQGYAPAQHNVAFFYESGTAVDANIDKAVFWYLKAAEQEFDQSQCSLGVLYEFGTGVKKDIKQAISWYEKAAAQGNAKAWGRLGWIFGQNNMQDRANFCYQKGVNGADPFAALQLAYRIMKGMLGTINYDKAIQLYEMAGEGGIADAYFLLGELYDTKEGGRYNREKALYYYKLAADQGCERAYAKI